MYNETQLNICFESIKHVKSAKIGISTNVSVTLLITEPSIESKSQIQLIQMLLKHLKKRAYSTKKKLSFFAAMSWKKEAQPTLWNSTKDIEDRNPRLNRF
jgi:flavorubredoxin